MLDTKQSWDNLVRRHAPDAATAARILENPLYQNISGRFVQSHEYIAMERLYELHAEGNYDLIVVDTPPTRNALDFIEAPERMAEFFSSRLLRLLIVPYRTRLVNFASRPFYQVADRILGSQFLQDIAEFFILFQTMYAGFVERSQAVARLLRDKRTTFVVVTTLEAAPVHEAEFFIDVLTAKKFHLDALVLNKVLPAYFNGEAASARAALTVRPGPGAGGQGGRPSRGTPTRPRWSGCWPRWPRASPTSRVVAQREASQRAELSAAPAVVADGALLRDRHLRPRRACCDWARSSGPDAGPAID